mmetsp:Transcript_325/g.682  ORF Transcript_325/g.682 Transcript_325/m.682 type:complete len:217 (-) Transcript_325:1023-1673(-)
MMCIHRSTLASIVFSSIQMCIPILLTEHFLSSMSSPQERLKLDFSIYRQTRQCVFPLIASCLVNDGLDCPDPFSCHHDLGPGGRGCGGWPPSRGRACPCRGALRLGSGIASGSGPPCGWTWRAPCRAPSLYQSSSPSGPCRRARAPSPAARGCCYAVLSIARAAPWTPPRPPTWRRPCPPVTATRVAKRACLMQAWELLFDWSCLWGTSYRSLGEQ